VSEALREADEGGTQFLPIARRTEQKIVLIRERLQSIRRAHVVVVDVCQACDLELAVRQSHALMFLGHGDDLAVGRVCDDRRAVRAGAMSREKPGQHVKGDTGSRAADEISMADDRDVDIDDRVAGIGVDFRIRYDQRSRRLRRRVPGDSAVIHLGRDHVPTDDMPP
jgi:hypothetical protein